MIEMIQGLPDKVVAVRLTGVVKGEDYDNILVPVIEDKVKEYGKIRVLYQLGPDYEKFSRKAMLEDMELGVKNITSFDRIAVVSDVEWMNHAMELFKYMIPGQVKTYNNEELSEAKAWISE
ncbi:STAS/SEC14 domain-containing protein [Methanococcoides burtonii]|uniref:STAS/SEC14 domain-containing protein n=1 Tax=Methanococcoides burtonii (strain DSM 6242 / NBRC 107633 / OCM 468 / ACE-M) TaxID=259564 RepID=Q12ZF4_METBU|nr:STAS/SEC14 domain-containing protein [Methanococcoides burtonii]ABE51172.1 Hypothetical protein Mbur_0160 [Methanococcoides burtonii DSM 6242]